MPNTVMPCITFGVVQYVEAQNIHAAVRKALLIGVKLGQVDQTDAWFLSQLIQHRDARLELMYKTFTGDQAHPRREAWNSVIGGKEVLIKMGNINELKIRFGIRSYGFWSIGYFTNMGRFWNTVIYDLFLDLSIGLVSGS